MIQDHFKLQVPFWVIVSRLNNFNNIVFIIIGAFIAGWLISVLVYKLKKYGAVDEKAADEKAANEREAAVPVGTR